MAGETRNCGKNMLTAEELLENKGLKYRTWNEYEKSAKTLPKTGMKQFEPSNSWLENMQIEKGIMSRKNLIAIERVDRISQLASAEWLPEHKKAKVKKYSGQDWSSFGLEKNGSLYLIPEEALFLLEANCLELIWNNVPLSIQQAYDLLIDNVECTLEEYRVYSQLVRHGYRVQRFIYNSNNLAKGDKTNSTKRKIVIEPESVWSGNSEEERGKSTNNNQPSIEIDLNVSEEKQQYNNPEAVTHKPLCVVKNIETEPKIIELEINVDDQEKLHSDSQILDTNVEKQKEGGKVQIILEETLLGNIRIVKNHDPKDGVNENSTATNWRTSRIQRNVKLLPKRTDKITSLSGNTNSNGKSGEQYFRKHKSTSQFPKEIENKKSKQEVIELSDDEIEEVPKPMTRMELLNMIPNIASQTSIRINISRRYIPNTVKPAKTGYHYETSRLRNLKQTNRHSQSSRNSDHSERNNVRTNTNVAPYNQSLVMNMHNAWVQDCLSTQQRKDANFGLPYTYNNVVAPMHNTNTFLQNVCAAYNNYGSFVNQNRYSSVQMMVRNLVQNQYQHNVYQNVVRLQNFHTLRALENSLMQYRPPRRVLLPTPRPSYRPSHHYRGPAIQNHRDESYQSTFKVIRGVSSWSELKSRWNEERTITIDSEDVTNEEIEDCDTVQVVKQLRRPLVGPKCVENLRQVFDRLNIIKSATEKSVRRKNSKYRISYNVYSNTQNYRKANPGLPLHRIAVMRQNDSFIQPIELQRLMQDADNSPIILAYVSMSISYIQTGFVSISNLTQLK